MERTYKCPKCGGNDIYFAKRQRITGLGGIYGNRAKMVDTPLCRVCGEIANKMATSQEIKQARALARVVAPLVKPFERFNRLGFKGRFLVLCVLFLLIITLSYI